MFSNPLHLLASVVRCELWPYINIEPAYFLAYLSAEMMDFLNANLYLQKACRFDRFSEPDLASPCDDEKQGVEFVTKFFSTAAMITGCASLVITMFLTSFSDLVGKKRKPFILISVFGLLLQSASAMLQAFFWHWPPLLGIVLNGVLPDLLGGNAAVMVFCVLLIYDKSRPENRHISITTVVCLRSLGTFIGKGLAGHLLRGVGFFYSFGFCCLLYCLSLVCVFAFVRDPEPVPAERQQTLVWVQIFNLRKLYESFKTILFSKRCVRHRIVIWILQVLATLVHFTVVGESVVFYLYLRYRFHWDEKQFSNYSAYKVVTGLAGSMLCTFIMSKLLKVHDSIIGTFAAAMDTLAAIGFLFAIQEWHLYVVPLLDVFHGVALSTCYSFISKFFTDQEFGRLHSVHMFFNLATVLSLPVYSLLFTSTMDTNPNAFFLLSVVLNAVICISYSVTYFLGKDIANE